MRTLAFSVVVLVLTLFEPAASQEPEDELSDSPLAGDVEVEQAAPDESAPDDGARGQLEVDVDPPQNPLALAESEPTIDQLTLRGEAEDGSAEAQLGLGLALLELAGDEQQVSEAARWIQMDPRWPAVASDAMDVERWSSRPRAARRSGVRSPFVPPAWTAGSSSRSDSTQMSLGWLSGI